MATAAAATIAGFIVIIVPSIPEIWTEAQAFGGELVQLFEHALRAGGRVVGPLLSTVLVVRTVDITLERPGSQPDPKTTPPAPWDDGPGDVIAPTPPGTVRRPAADHVGGMGGQPSGPRGGRIPTPSRPAKGPPADPRPGMGGQPSGPRGGVTPTPSRPAKRPPAGPRPGMGGQPSGDPESALASIDSIGRSELPTARGEPPAASSPDVSSELPHQDEPLDKPSEPSDPEPHARSMDPPADSKQGLPDWAVEETVRLTREGAVGTQVPSDQSRRDRRSGGAPSAR
jgi:hypothetical protein